MRIGLHSGTVVASVVGTLMPRWCLFGEDLATVANCESLGEANKIHLSAAIYERLQKSKFLDGRQMFEPTNEQIVKMAYFESRKIFKESFAKFRFILEKI